MALSLKHKNSKGDIGSRGHNNLRIIPTLEELNLRSSKLQEALTGLVEIWYKGRGTSALLCDLPYTVDLQISQGYLVELVSSSPISLSISSLLSHISHERRCNVGGSSMQVLQRIIVYHSNTNYVLAAGILCIRITPRCGRVVSHTPTPLIL